MTLAVTWRSEEAAVRRLSGHVKPPETVPVLISARAVRSARHAKDVGDGAS